MNAAHLWAVAFDDVERADQLRTAVLRLADEQQLVLLDTAIVVRYDDGSITIDGEPFVAPTKQRPHTFASFLAGMALTAPPLTGTAVGMYLDGAAPQAEKKRRSATSSLEKLPT